MKVPGGKMEVIMKSGNLSKFIDKSGEFLGILLDTLGTSLLGSLLACKVTIRAGEEAFRAGQDFSCHLSF